MGGVPVRRDEWIAISWVLYVLIGVRSLEDGSVVTWGLETLGLVNWLFSPPFFLCRLMLFWADSLCVLRLCAL